MFKKFLAMTIFGASIFTPIILPQNNFVPVSIAHAELITIETDGYYTMGDGMEENQSVAKGRAREDAKRAASERASVFIESISEVQGSNLTRDEIRTVSSSILKIISDPVTIETNGDSLVFHCHIKAIVDTSKVADTLLQDRQKLDDTIKRLQEIASDIARLNAEMNSLREKYSTASESEKQQINIEIKRNEEQFTTAHYNNTAVNYVNLGDYNKAIEFYNKIIETNPKNSPSWNNLGDAYNSLGNYDKAIECFNKAIELDPKLNAPYNNLGSIYNSMGKSDKAIECFRKVVEFDSKNDTAWIALSTLYNSINEYAKAAECFQKAVEVNPKNDDAWICLGSNYNLLGEFKKAAECFQKSIELNPKNDSAYNNLGFSYSLLSEYDKAIEYYNKAIEINPKDDSTWNNLGFVYTSLGKYDKAIECLNKAIEINPKEDVNWNNLGDAYSLAKNYNKALECFDKAIELNPENTDYSKSREVVLAKMK